MFRRKPFKWCGPGKRCTVKKANEITKAEPNKLWVDGYNTHMEDRQGVKHVENFDALYATEAPAETEAPVEGGEGSEGDAGQEASNPAADDNPEADGPLADDNPDGSASGGNGNGNAGSG